MLKELFGGSSGQDEDFIAKSLFGRQDQEQLGHLRSNEVINAGLAHHNKVTFTDCQIGCVSTIIYVFSSVGRTSQQVDNDRYSNMALHDIC